MLTSNPNPVGPEAYNRQAQAYLRYDALDRLAELKSPTLVIVGEQDLLTPPWICREVADRIPGSQFETVVTLPPIPNVGSRLPSGTTATPTVVAIRAMNTDMKRVNALVVFVSFTVCILPFAC